MATTTRLAPTDLECIREDGGAWRILDGDTVILEGTRRLTRDPAPDAPDDVFESLGSMVYQRYAQYLQDIQRLARQIREDEGCRLRLSLVTGIAEPAFQAQWICNAAGEW